MSPLPRLGALVVVGLLAATGVQADQTVPWPNGDFSLGGAGWAYPSTTVITDHDGDGDVEALFLADGGWFYHLSMGFAKGAVPATTPFSFHIERGSMVMDFRMLILCGTNPVPYVSPNPFDDLVLSWNNNWAPVSGHLTLDPVDAKSPTIPGWGSMDAESRHDYLSGCVYGTLVMYAVASGFKGGATVDDFAWEL